MKKVKKQKQTNNNNSNNKEIPLYMPSGTYVRCISQGEYGCIPLVDNPYCGG